MEQDDKNFVLWANSSSKYNLRVGSDKKLQ